MHSQKKHVMKTCLNSMRIFEIQKKGESDLVIYILNNNINLIYKVIQKWEAMKGTGGLNEPIIV